MALEDVSAHRGGTDPIEGLIRIETSPREQATPIIMEMIRRGSVDSGVTAATWTAALTRPDGVGEDAEISTAPVLITEHEVVFGRAAALPVQRAKVKPIAAGHSTGSHHRRNLAVRTNLLTCVRSPDRSHQPLGQTLGNICQNHRNFAETPA